MLDVEVQRQTFTTEGKAIYTQETKQVMRHRWNQLGQGRQSHWQEDTQGRGWSERRGQVSGWKNIGKTQGDQDMTETKN